MELMLAVTGHFGHAKAEFMQDTIVITYKKTTPGERGTIEMLVEKAVKKGMSLHTGKNGEVQKPLERILDVLMDKKGQVILKGENSAVESLALETVEEEIKSNRIVSEAQEDGTWKVLEIGEFKAEDKKKSVTSHAPALGG